MNQAYPIITTQRTNPTSHIKCKVEYYQCGLCGRTSKVIRFQCSYNSGRLYFQKYLPYTTTITAEGTARLFLYYVWKLHGLLNHVVLDRNLQFVILFTQELYHFPEIEITLFMA